MIDAENEAFIDRWVKPFYLNNLRNVEDVKSALAEVDPSIVSRLLATPNWRERIVGGWFSGLKDWQQFEGQIGSLLLASDLVYAGRGYCFALACFADDTSRRYLTEYLDRYLRHPEKFYDQHHAIVALLWIDEKHGTSDAARFLEPGGLWETFAAGKNDAWNVDHCKKNFWHLMQHCQHNFGTP